MPENACLSLCVLLLAFAIAGCSPHVGDKCVLNTDCSVTGNLQCDTSMPGGYCTVFNCGPNSCPNGDACYLFHADVQGCPYNDRQPSRTAHSFCMEDCSKDGDCRSGYSCHDLRQGPWDAILLDDNQQQAVCVPNYDPAFTAGVSDGSALPPPICDPSGDYDAEFPPEPSDAGESEAGDAALEDAGDARGPFDAGLDATLDAGFDATLDATAQVDAGGPDAGASDATID